MRACLCVPGADARFSSARAVTAASSTARGAVAPWREANRYAPRGVVTSNRAAAGTAMANASDAIGAGAVKGLVKKM